MSMLKHALKKSFSAQNKIPLYEDVYRDGAERETIRISSSSSFLYN